MPYDYVTMYHDDHGHPKGADNGDDDDDDDAAADAAAAAAAGSNTLAVMTK